MSSKNIKEVIFKTSIFNELDIDMTAINNSTLDKTVPVAPVTANATVPEIEKTQYIPNELRPFIKTIARNLAKGINETVYSLYKEATRNIPHSDLNDGNLWKTFSETIQVMKERNGDTNNVVFEVSPAIYSVIRDEAIKLGLPATLVNGRLTEIYGIPVYVTNDIKKVVDDLGNIAHKCLCRTKDAISYNLDNFELSITDEGVVTATYSCGAFLKNPDGLILMDLCFPH